MNQEQKVLDFITTQNFETDIFVEHVESLHKLNIEYLDYFIIYADKDETLLYSLAYHYFHNGEKIKALECFEKLLQKNNTNKKYKYYIEEIKKEQKVLDFITTQNFETDIFIGYVKEDYAYKINKNYLDYIIIHAEKNDTLLFSLGYFYYTTLEFAKAAECFKILKTKNNSILKYKYWYHLIVSKYNYSKIDVINDFTIDDISDNIDDIHEKYLFMLADAYYHEKEYLQAEKLFKYLELREYDLQNTYTKLINIYREIKSKNNLIKYYEKYISKVNNISSGYAECLADIYLQDKNYEKAAKWYIEEFKFRKSYYYPFMACVCYAKLNNIDKARNYYLLGK